jgi:4-azaleucine resistance transporter AzlC
MEEARSTREKTGRITRSRTRAIARRAFVDSLPVLMGYTTMGFVAGVLLAAKGDVILSPVWGFLSAALWVTGTMSIAGVPEIAARTTALQFAVMTLAVNFRYVFYGFSMLSRWKDVPFLRKAYLILMLTDENYALEASCKIRDKKENLNYCTFLSSLNHSYWIVGVTAGTLAVKILGHVVSPEKIRAWTNGMEFSMAALFIVILTDQLRAIFSRRST